MPTKWIPYVKALVHLLCLLPFVELLRMYNSGAFGLYVAGPGQLHHTPDRVLGVVSS